MGELSEFEPGDKVPNDGKYTEVGEKAFHMGINDPQTVTLKQGDTFPETSNKNRKWKRVK
ncbi:YjzC family protein [Ferviditalea candida]|uniref:YjzC family protein n=1 Tax=Ferviditalea candida TaxID=3108399 RepID=A0ABU5ZLT3_9BACL|nr:YjzC family protein [Paenibacillaceae bacterium T2]